METDQPVVPVETITLPLTVLTPAVRAALKSSAKQKVDKGKADDVLNKYDEHMKKSMPQNTPGPQVDQMRSRAHAKKPDLFRAYQGHWYALKLDPLVAADSTAPKVTILRELITPQIQAEIEACLTEIEETENPIHPWHVQARERLGKMTPWVDTPEPAPTGATPTATPTAIKETKK